MSQRLKAIVHETAKVAVVAWVVLIADPWLQTSLPNLGPGWRYAASALITALILECVLQFAFGWPRVNVCWVDNTTPAPVRSIYLTNYEYKDATQTLTLRISTARCGWLGRKYLKMVLGNESTLRICVDQATIKPTVDDCSYNGKVPAFSADADSKGFNIRLGPSPKRDGNWHWGYIFWTDVRLPENTEVNIDYLIVHPKSLNQFLLKFIRVSSNADSIQVSGV